jgi:hypothetical protein
MKIVRRFAIGLLIVGAGAGAGLFFYLSIQRSSVQMMMGNTASAEANQPLTGVPPLGEAASRQSARDQAPIRDKTVIKPLANPLLLTTEARPFVLKHIRDQAGFDRVFARKIVQDCIIARSVLKIHTNGNLPATSNPDNAAIMNQALDAFQRKCGQFSDVELEEFALIRFTSTSPLISMFNGDEYKENPAAHEKAIEELVLSGNPVLFDDLALQVLVQKNESGRYVYFQGTKYYTRENKIGEALWLVPCHLGLDCGPTSMRYGVACLTGNECSLPNLNANVLAREIAAAIAAGDVGSFRQ